MTWTAEFQTLIAEADRAGSDREKCLILERAIDLADANQDVDAGYRARSLYFDPATFSGRTDLGLAAFIWCLSRLDEDPERNAREEAAAKNGGGLFWAYKWMADNATFFPDFSRHQLLSLFDDMRSRFDRIGIGQQCLHGVATEIFWLLGDDERSFAENERESNLARDRISDCAACVLNRRVTTLVRSGRDQEAILAARPISERRMSCRLIPKATFAALLPAYLRTGMREEGMNALRGLLPTLGSLHHKDATYVADAVIFLTLTGNLAKAVGLVQKHVQLLRPHAHQHNLHLFSAMTLLFTRLVADGRKTLTLRFPATHPQFDQERWDLPDLLARVDRAGAELAERFDRRNGNQTLGLRRRKLLDSLTDAVDWPLQPR